MKSSKSAAGLFGGLSAATALLVGFAGTKILLATDLGVGISTDRAATWSRLGSNLPYTTALDIHLGPDGRVYAVTHGRGIWSIAQP